MNNAVSKSWFFLRSILAVILFKPEIPSDYITVDLIQAQRAGLDPRDICGISVLVCPSERALHCLGHVDPEIAR